MAQFEVTTTVQDGERTTLTQKSLDHVLRGIEHSMRHISLTPLDI